jgi:UDP-N-acetylglucosamine--N-acetylmuramyl-(pentapeptide) pyrophosphoryl-undecaprenol N-acetylglucosamine transferase
LKNLKILVAAGGTGGHLFPAIAVVDALRKKLPNFTFHIYSIGNPEKIESKASLKYGWEFFPIPMRGFTGFGLKTISFFLKTIRSVYICRNIISKNNIDFVIATGAYVSYPAGIAAKAENKPLFLVETNVFPGRANRLLSRRADLIFLAFEETRRWLNPNTLAKTFVVGIPVRKELLNAVPKDEAKKNLQFEGDKPVLLVFGGSLGALSMNRAMKNIYEHLLAERVQILWQIGKNFNEHIPQHNGLKVVEFIDDMATAYSAADLVVSRAGASTIAELSALGKPAILVPYPNAVNNHQELNAIELERSGSAIMLKDSEIEEKLLPKIKELIFSNDKLLQLSQNIRQYGVLDSAEKIAEGILKFLNI